MILVFLLFPCALIAEETPSESKGHIDLEKDEKVLERVESQEQGYYGKMEREDAVAPLGDIQEAWDNADEKAGIYRVKFDPYKVIRLNLRQHMLTTIVFPEWEEINDTGLGDKIVFEAHKLKKNIIILYPKYAGADTNFTVYGEFSRAPYTFYLRSTGVHAKNTSDFTVFIDAVPPLEVLHSRKNKDSKEKEEEAVGNKTTSLFVGKDKNDYPELDFEVAMELIRIGSGGEEGYEKTDFLVPLPVKKEEIDFAYTMHGDKRSAPKNVFNDGLFTYLYYGDNWDKDALPSIHLVEDDVERAANYRVKGRLIVVEGLGNLSLRIGQKQVCIKMKGGGS